ncbi:hypothetical protein ES702_01709 [subsurface metagenome]
MPVNEGGGGSGAVSPSDLKGLFAEKELEKRDKKALFDKLDRVEGQLKIIGNTICDSEGRCRLATKEELEKLRPKEALSEKLDRVEGQLKIIGNMICDEKGRCRLATKEELATLGQKEKKLEEYHSQELWEEIKQRPQAMSDLEGVMLKKLKENEDLMRRVAEDETFREKFLESVCTTKGCRQALNLQIEQARKKYPEEKQSWMIKKK